MSIGIVYETVCLHNGMRYRGKHWCTERCSPCGDARIGCHYIGSGTELARARSAYGDHMFGRKVIATTPYPEGLYALEALFIPESWVQRADNYNLRFEGDSLEFEQRGEPELDETGRASAQYQAQCIKKMALERAKRNMCTLAKLNDRIWRALNPKESA